MFTDDIQRIAPFYDDGQQAVRAYVFTCDDNAHHWVQFLEKWSDSGKNRLAQMQSKAPGEVEIPGVQDSLVKKPGDREWVTRDRGQKKSSSRNVPTRVRQRPLLVTP